MLSVERCEMTLGELKRTGYRRETVKDEMRRNLRRKLAAGETLFPGIVGYDETVIPQIVNAILARHDLILLGLRGQAKTRLLRALVNLLDDTVPVVAGSPLNDDPLHPVSAYARRVLAEEGDDTRLDLMPRERRYNEKLATPDVSIADLIGDIDPIKASREQRDFSDEEVIHYGIIPRTNRGIFAINELPDLQPRIQVGLLNIMEEKDVQIRGFPIRLSLDIVMVYTANPEDYTNRGAIITPLKDRIDSQIITHYPEDLEQAVAITDQEAWVDRGADIRVPPLFKSIIEHIAFAARDSAFVDQSSGVSARLSIAARESLVSNLEKRALLKGESPVNPRICDLYALLPAMTGKLELVYEGEREGTTAVALQLIGEGVKRAFRAEFPEVFRLATDKQPVADERSRLYRAVSDYFKSDQSVEIADDMAYGEYVARLDAVTGLREVVAAKYPEADAGEIATLMEFALEGLHQHSILAKASLTRAVKYQDVLATMFREFE
jgi:magnesium chelatase subunit I